LPVRHLRGRNNDHASVRPIVVR